MVQQMQTLACVLILLFFGIGTLAVAIRMWSRYITKNWGTDDGIILFAYILAVAETICVYQYTLLSYQGYHEADIPPQTIEQKVLAAKYNIANQVLYNPILSLIKLSVIIFLRRLEDRRKSIKYNLYALAIFETMVMVSSTLVDLFQCTPVQYAWESARMDADAQKAAGGTEVNGVPVTGGRCIQTAHFFLATAGINIFTDVWILIIPALMLWHLRMPRRQKLAVFAILGAGGIVVIVSIVRIIIYAWRFSPNNHDQSWGVGFTTSGMVVNIAFLAACAPALKAIFTRYLPKIFGLSRYYLSRGNAYHYGYGRSNKTNNTNNGVGGITVTNTIHVSQDNDHEMRSGISHNKQATESEEEIIPRDDLTPSIRYKSDGQGSQGRHTSPKEFVR